MTPHAGGRWCKKVNGKIHYFGTWEDPEGALNEWLDQKDFIIAGRDPNEQSGDWTFENLANVFLDEKQALVEQGDLTQWTFDSLKSAAQRFANHFGKRRLAKTFGTADFIDYRKSFPATWGPIRTNDEIGRVRSIWKYAFEQVAAIPVPVRFGSFKKLSKKRMRLHRAGLEPKLFAAAEIRSMIDNASVNMRAMIYLGINCGYGNADCGRLTWPSIDFDKKWIGGLRQKTAVERASWLWPETIEALRAVQSTRSKIAPAELAERVFVTKYGKPWYDEGTGGGPMPGQFSKLCKAVGCYRDKVGFYALRHTFETVAGNSRDQVAVNYVMGHVDDSMAAVYRESIDPQRVIEVCQFVHGWLFDGEVK